MTKQIDELRAYVTDHQPHPLGAQLADWLNASPRFVAFTLKNRDKIRKKLRSAQVAESARDLHLELATAFWLLQERRFTLDYEKNGTGVQRAPDFTVTFKANTMLNIEVTRMRATEITATSVTQEQRRFSDIVCSKLGQLIPGMINVLLVGVEPTIAPLLDVDATLRRLKQQIEARDPHALGRSGFRDPADFFKHYGRLSAIIVWAEAARTVWLNKAARHALLPDLHRALQR